MIITIDGPAGAGKSTVAKMLAKELQFSFLDTGAMYRAITWAALENEIDVANENAVATVAAKLEIQFEQETVLVGGRDVSKAIRERRITKSVSEIADNQTVREQLVMLQREIASNGNYVCEGRDQGTVAFPNADCKIFLTASNRERARRRLDELKAKGHDLDFETVLREQDARDQRDQNRPWGSLIKADDAVEVVTDGMSLLEVVERLKEIAQSRIVA